MTAATVHTQHAATFGDQSENKNLVANSEEVSAEYPQVTKKPETWVKKKESGRLFRDALKKLQKPGSEPKPCSSRSVSKQEEEDKPTPKYLQHTKSETGKKDRYLLKKSALGAEKRKKASYLSKSDTILERTGEFEDVADRRSRSASPSTGFIGTKSLKCAVESIIRERRRTKSLGQAPRTFLEEDVNAWEFSDSALSQYEKNPEFPCRTSSIDEEEELNTTHDSISVSLPLLRETKVLDEREEAGRKGDTEFRPSSLDLEEEVDGSLTRSTSEDTIQSGSSILISESLIERAKKYQLEPYLTSPESNETLERRHLKSILKTLSAEENDGISPKINEEDMKKLLVAPTIEGYAARHSKLTKSVTFNKTLSSPPPSPVPIATPISVAKQRINTSLTNENEQEQIVGQIVVGIKQLMQAYLVEVERKMECKLEHYEMEVRERDTLIATLRRQLDNLQNGGDVDILENDEDEDYPFMRETSCETVLGLYDGSEDDEQERNLICSPTKFDHRASHIFRSAVQCGRLIRRHSQKELIELKNFHRGYGASKTRVRRAKSEEEAARRDYVSLDLEESDSEIEYKNWEVDMLVHELEEREKKSTENSLNKIESEVKVLQHVVENTDLENLSPTEFNALQNIINQSDRKISSISNSKSSKRLTRHSSFDYPSGKCIVRNPSSFSSDNLGASCLPTSSSSSFCSSGFRLAEDNDSVFEEEHTLRGTNTESLSSSFVRGPKLRHEDMSHSEDEDEQEQEPQ